MPQLDFSVFTLEIVWLFIGYNFLLLSAFFVFQSWKFCYFFFRRVSSVQQRITVYLRRSIFEQTFGTRLVVGGRLGQIMKKILFFRVIRHRFGG